MKIYFCEEYVASAEAFDTTRKPAWVAASLAASPIPGVELVRPEPLTLAQIRLAHTRAYIAAVQSGKPQRLAWSNGLAWCRQMWTMARYSNGGVVAAVREARRDKVNTGSLSCGLHHARREKGGGYCTFNGLAIAALVALAEGAESVLIVDLDAHCGGGTHAILCDEPRVTLLDVSVCNYDRYVSAPPSSLRLVRDASRYLEVIRERLKALHQQKFDVCIYNAGMDPCEDCEAGGLAGVTAKMLARREALVFGWCRQQGIPAAFVLAGGYTGPQLSREQLVALHRLTIRAAARGCTSR
jgi:acetoin utilization deacetylase AcuC-like enzyme